MRIGDLASNCGLPARTIRFYERGGLLPVPERDANGYRRYDPAAIEQVTFIRRAQAAGLTLVEIRSILEVRANGQPPCTHVGALLHAKLNDVDRRLTELATLRTELVALTERADQLDPADCTARDICHILR